MTQNFWILPNFILCRSGLVRNLNIVPNFQNNSEFLHFAKIHPSHIRGGQKSQFWAKFSASEISILSQILNASQNFWILQLFSLCRSEVSKITILSQIYKMTENSWILPKFILRTSRVSEISILSQIFSVTQNFWILPSVIFCRPRVVKNLNFEPHAKFSKWLKISGFWQISSFAGSEWSEISIWSQIFKMTQISRFFQISSFAGSEWLEISILSHMPHFQNDSKFLDFDKFYPLQVRSGKKSQFWAKFSKRLKICVFCQFSPFGGCGQKYQLCI